MAGMTKEVLFRVGADATAVSAGMTDAEKRIKTSINRILGIQTQAEKEYSRVWKQAEQERARADKQREEREKADHARRVREWKDELKLQREAAGVQARQARNQRGVDIGGLRQGKAGHHSAGGGMSGAIGTGAAREGMVIAREIAAGNFTGAFRSVSVLMGSLGMLGKVIAAIVNPVAGVIAGAGLGAFGAYQAGINAYNLRRDAREAGFSVTGYQAVKAQAAREGGSEVGVAAMNSLQGAVRGAASGNMGDYSKFVRWGVSMTDANGKLLSTEKIYERVIDKIGSTASSARRAAMGMDFFGESYKGMLRTIEEGSEGLQKYKALSMSDSDNAAMAEMGGVMRSGWEKTKRGGGMLWLGAKNMYASYARAVNPNLNRIANETTRGALLDEQMADVRLQLRKKYGSRERDYAQLQTLNPQLAVDYQGAITAQTKAQANIDDRNKGSLDSLAEQGRGFTGMIHRKNYAMTARMKTALRIQDIEEQAKVAWERGDDTTHKKLTDQALSMRAANPWLALSDKNPMLEANQHLAAAELSLKKMEKMADVVIQDSQRSE